MLLTKPHLLYSLNQWEERCSKDSHIFVAFQITETSINFITFFFFFLVLHSWNMEVPRLWVESELYLLAYATATTMQDPSQVFNLHHSSRQCRILNPMSEAGDQTCVLMDASQIC